MTRAVYSGSFDPVTYGHLDIIARSVEVFDAVMVAVAINSRKTPLFTAAERVDLLQKAIAASAAKGYWEGTNRKFPSEVAERITVTTTTGLLAEFAKSVGANAIVRGVRTTGEFEAEMSMALLNRQLAGIETVMLIADPNLGHISSSAVKEIAHFGGDVTGFVPPVVAEAMNRKR